MKDIFKFFDLQLFAEEETSEETTEQETNESAGNVVFDKAQQLELERIIQERLSRERRKMQKASKAEEERKEADRLKSLSEVERQREEYDQIKKEVAELKKEKKHSEMMSAARSEFQARGYNFSDSIIQSVISDNADDTKEAIDSFVSEFEKAVNSAVKKKVNVTEPKTTGKVAKKPREEVFKMLENEKSASARQKIIKENIDLF